MQTTPITADQVEAALRAKVGREQGIHVKQLVQLITNSSDSHPADERRVRDLINDLRMKGHPICGRPESGYFIASNLGELDKTCNYLKGRAQSTLDLVERMQSGAAVLAGQVAFDTTLDTAGAAQ